MIEKLIEIHLSLAKEVEKLSYRRYLFDKISWNNRLIGIVGARGVGKTTLLLQYYLYNFKTPQDCLYLSADNINVINKGLYNIAEEFFKFGGKTLLIDEIHKYPDWQIELKNIYDSSPKKKIIFSGSSSIGILKGKGDLSRRAVFYNLRGLSFREYLILRLNKQFQPLDFKDLLKEHIKLADKISSQLPVLKYFREYLKYGYYPFFKEGVESFYNKLGNVIEKIFYEDMPSLFNIKHSTIYNLKKLFYLVATSQPFIPNISKISSQLGISKEYIYTYIEELQKAGLFILLYPKTKGFSLLRKPQKIYSENTNLFYLIEQEKGFTIEKGSIRETFLLNQLGSLKKLYYSDKVDFMDREGRLFEVGGKEKKASSKDIFLALDDIIVGFRNRIPLWLFGFLY
ncbi:MAG: AAA family ATPase [Candidatus Omnitrophota bacterium]|nr:MAG: AAA family ATPase [Candidatus Omnitrophota bacterium]